MRAPDADRPARDGTASGHSGRGGEGLAQRDTLSAIVRAAASDPGLDGTLTGVVDLLQEGTGCRGCFIYLREGDRLLLRAASKPYRHLVSRHQLRLDEGLAGWVARSATSDYIPTRASADPRVKVVPQLGDEEFEALAAVPILARSGESIGVLMVQSVAPRDFDETTFTLLGDTASLVAGSTEMARLREEASCYAGALRSLAALGRRIAEADALEQCYAIVADGLHDLLEYDAVQLYLFDRAGRLEPLGAGEGERPPGSPAGPLLEAVRESARNGRGSRSSRDLGLTVAPITVADDYLGVLTVTADPPLAETDEELLGLVALHVAVRLKQFELTERLEAEDPGHRFFEALAAGAPATAAALARDIGCDASRPHAVVHVEPLEAGGGVPMISEALEARLRRTSAVVVDRGERGRALAGLPRGDADEGLVELASVVNEFTRAERVVAGVSEPRIGAGECGAGLREARDAARMARGLLPDGGALAYASSGSTGTSRVPPRRIRRRTPTVGQSTRSSPTTAPARPA